VKRVYESPYVEIDLDEQRHVVFARRTKTPFPDNESIRRLGPHFHAALPAEAQRRELGLLIDMRAPALNNSPGFEEAMQAFVIPATIGFRKIATVVRTNVGVLQVNRVGRRLADNRAVFLDESEALAFLAETEDAPS
jgi:hypothetical protein